ncbi:hypothetical protein TDB9533_01797 [Thalassocella blandensis]|nr:hypothetical protein TDB9533_01797 [Thalassocella blandensis]
MSEELYDIVFKGDLVKSVDPATAKQNVGKLFKMDGAKLDALFSGKTIVLKRGLDFDTASKYRVAIKKAGAVVNLQAQQDSTPKPKPSQGKAVFGEQPSQASQQPVSATPSAPAVQQNSAAEDDAAFTIAPVGSDMIEAKDRPRVAAVQVDVAGISLKEGGGDLLEDNEKRRYEDAQIDTSALDVAPVGADVLTVSERKKVEAVEVDVSALNIAEPGSRLSDPSPEPPPAPDVSRIQLAD